TTAMLLAEMIAANEPDPKSEEEQAESRHQNQHFKGLVLANGLALGHIVLHEPRVEVTKLISDDASMELSRLNEGIGTLRSWTDKVLQRRDVDRGGEHRDVLEAYRMFAYDRGWARRMREAVGTGLTAEAAVERVQSDNRARMVRQTDPYLRERLHDFDDLSNRLLRILTGKTLTAAGEEIPQDSVVIARNMGPADLLDYDRARLRGLILEEGGPLSHVAIVARALGIAAVGQIGDILDTIEPGDAVIVDAEAGEVHLRPTADVEVAYADKVRFRAKQQEKHRAERDQPAVTKDGHKIGLLMNAGLLVELPQLEESGAAGIGLYRTELQFMLASRFPRLEEQMQMYQSVLAAAGDKPVVFRSLDVGGDKVLPYLRHAHEENPALGWRAIRIALDRPGLFRMQMRSLLRAAAGKDLWVMFPMITDVSEFDQVKELVEHEVALMQRFGHQEPSNLNLGAMIEVPAILWQLDSLFQRVDFASIGSNDLLQYLRASDRSNPRMAKRFDPLSPSVLRMLKDVVQKAKAHNIPLTLCGEMAGSRLEAMALLSIGLRAMSMASPSIGPIKAMIRALDLKDLEDYITAAIEQSEDSLRPLLADYAERNNIPV
ncbi:MAG: phosphoenolpyruvate--protein phosphotransferase, partial [Fimbriimonadaceae bacterium]|nr:phosphoenolpyruvate--protein phosphotransferase [Alphaproteobacteria bacterium]